MDFSTRTGAPEKTKTACAVVGMYADGVMTASAQAFDAAAGGAIARLVKRGDANGKKGSVLMLSEGAGAAARVAIVGLGKPDELTDKIYAEALRAAARTVSATPASEALLCLSEVVVPGRDAAWKARAAAIAFREVLYRFDQMKSKPENSVSKLKRLELLAGKSDVKRVDAALAQGAAIANGLALARDLGNLPPNRCTPTHLADTAKAIARQFKLKVEVLDRKQIEALKMGSFLSVAQGSEEPPKFIVLRHNGGEDKAAPVVLVGKGITFDSGGISLKPGAGMDEMKFDMCGAASVLGTLRAVAEMKLALNVIGVIPACENLPSGRAVKPGDIVTSMSGQTIEILNTDAEGRLILCDALTYVERFNPAAVVDIATLTGACVTALGNVNSGLFSRDDALAGELLAAARGALDPAWRMPLDEEYQEQLKSNFADMANIGGPPAGAVTAACFLSRFTKKYAWAHLDIAGTAWKSGPAKGATGRPVPLLTEFLIGRAR